LDPCFNQNYIGLYDNSYCEENEVCGKWKVTSKGPITEGCILKKYCGVISSFNKFVTQFQCPFGKEKEGKMQPSAIVPVKLLSSEGLDQC